MLNAVMQVVQMPVPQPDPVSKLWASVPPWLQLWVGVLVAVWLAALVYTMWSHRQLDMAVRAITGTFGALGPLDDDARLRGRTLVAVDKWRAQLKGLEAAHRTVADEIERDLVMLRDENADTRFMLRDGEHDRLSNQALAGRHVNLVFVDALPGLLTAAGLVGTFAAIAYGLGFLDPQPNGMINGVNDLLRGIGGKFVTSVAALGLALVYQLLDTLWFARARAQAHRTLMDALGNAFPRLAPQQQVATLLEVARRQEQSLANISSDVVNKFSAAFTDDLLPNLGQLLAKQLESELGGVLEKVAEGIKSLELGISRLESGKTESIAEEVRGLTQNLEQAMRAAFEEMTTQFRSSLSGAADQEFKNAAAALGESAGVLRGMNEAFTGMQTAMEGMLKDAESRSQKAFDEGEGRTKALNDLVERLVNRLNTAATTSAGEVQRLLVQAVSGMSDRVTKLADEMDQQARASADATRQANAAMVDQVTQAAGRTSQETERLLATLGERANDFVQAANQLRELREGVEKVLAATADRLHDLNAAAAAFRTVATEASTLTTALKESQSRQQQATEKANQLVAGVATLTRDQEQALARTKATFEQAQAVLGALDERLASAMKEILSRMQDYNGAVEGNFRTIMANVNQNMPALFDRLDGSLKQVAESVEELSEVAGKLRPGAR